MSFWKLLDDFWGPLEGAANDALACYDRCMDQSIRDDIERDRLREEMIKGDRAARHEER
jgi:hypothetical protein